MNFADGPHKVPELAWRFRYAAVMLGMLAVGLLMLRAFPRRNYL